MADQEKIKELQEELAQYKLKGYLGYYYELNKWVNGTVDMMRTKGIKSLLTIDEDTKDAKQFEKMMALIKNTKEWIDNMEEIKQKFGLSGDEEKDKTKKPFIDRIAEVRN
jgi:hypothetical protein